MIKSKTSVFIPLSKTFFAAVLVASLVPFFAFGNTDIAALVAVSSSLAILFVCTLLYIQVNHSDLLMRLVKNQGARRTHNLKTE